jgi:hypothetical protein
MVPIWLVIILCILCILMGAIGFVMVALFFAGNQEKHNKYCLKIAAERALDELKRLQRLIMLADQDLVEDLENALKERWE